MPCFSVYLSAYLTIHVLVFDFILGYNVRNSHYVIKGARKLQASQITQTVTARSRLECSVLCGTSSTCTSGSYDLTSHTCFLSTLTSAEMTVYTDSDSDWSSFGVNEWLLVFRAPKGIGGNPYTSYVDATGVTTSDTSCTNLTSTSCTNNYRHPIIDQWNTANFEQVKVSLYKDQAEDAYIVFNATGSDKMSWFRKERILDSSWTNAVTDEYNYFSIEGYTPERRFYINLNFGGCPADRLYMVALTAKMASACNFDDQPTYPQFLYANTTNPGYPESGTGTDLADFMAIFVK